MKTLRLSSTLALLLSLAAPAAAQTVSLQGRVTDPAGAVIGGAQVALTELATGARQQTRTQPDGTYRLGNLGSGRYVIEITAPGFGAFVREIALGTSDLVVDAALQIAQVQEEVTVLGDVTPPLGRIDMPLQDQPLTVHTVTAEFLEANAINDVVSALQHIPNVNAYTQYGVYEYYTFRGFSESVQMVDGVRSEGNRIRSQLANVERIEVLKGPASVLYGTDAIGATVNIVLKKPSPDPVYDFSLAGGSWRTFRGTAGATGRLGADRLLYRVDVGAESADNFRQDPSKRLNVTPTLLWQIGLADRLEIRYSFDRNDLSGDSGIPLVPLGEGFAPDTERTAIGDPLTRAVRGDGSDFIPNVPQDRRFNTPQDFALALDHNVRVSYARIFGRGFGFRNTLGYRHKNDEYWVAEFLDVTPPSQVNRGFLYFKHHERPSINQAELTGRVRFGIDHDFLAGWDYQRYGRYTHRRAGANFNTTPMDLYHPVEAHVFVNLADFPVTRIDHRRDRTHALFVQDTLTVTPQLKVVLGGRVDLIRRRDHRNPVVDGMETQGPVNLGENDKFTYRAGLVYQPTPQVDLYAQQATSFRPNFSVQPDGTPLEPEHGEQFELGQRSRILQDRLALNTAVFRTEKRNVARSRGGGFFDQIGKLRSSGFELDLESRLAPAWFLNVGYGFTSARFLDYATTTSDFTGNRPRRSPLHTVSVATSYAWAGGFTLSASARAVSEQFLNDGNTVAFNGYSVINLGASYSVGRLQYRLNLNNVTDTEYWQSSLGNRQLYPGQPFTAMATVRVRMN